MREYGSINSAPSFDEESSEPLSLYQQHTDAIAFSCSKDSCDGQHGSKSCVRIKTVGRLFVTVFLLIVASVGIVSWYRMSDDHVNSGSASMVTSQESSGKQAFQREEQDSFIEDHWKAVYLSVSNEYGELQPEYPWLGKSAKAILFEPHKEMNVKVVGMELLTSCFEYIWTLKDQQDGSIIEQTKTTIPSVQMHSTSVNTRLELTCEIFEAGSTESPLVTLVYSVFTKYAVCVCSLDSSSMHIYGFSFS